MTGFTLSRRAQALGIGAILSLGLMAAAATSAEAAPKHSKAKGSSYAKQKPNPPKRRVVVPPGHGGVAPGRRVVAPARRVAVPVRRSGYKNSYWYNADGRRRGDLDRDGIPNISDRDRDGDGVANRRDRHPDNRRRR